MPPVHGAISVDSAINRTAELTANAREADGWNLAAAAPNWIFYTKPGPDGATYLRYTITFDIMAEHMFGLLTDCSPESIQWRERIRRITVVHDYGPDDKVIIQELDLPWAISYITSIPNEMALRIAGRAGWPTATDYAYAVLPFDLEDNICLESNGLLKIKTGVVSPLPNDHCKCTLTGMDLVDLSMVPSWGMRFILRHVSVPAFVSMVEEYKKVKGL